MTDISTPASRAAVAAALTAQAGDANVTHIDYGYPIRGGEYRFDEHAVRVHVAKKRSVDELQALQAPIVPSEIAGVPTDVIESSYAIGAGLEGSPFDHRGRRDPMLGGTSISDEWSNAAGSLGCRVIDDATGRQMILSNWHVLAARWGAVAGQRIFQPGRLDGGTPADAVAALTRDAMALSLDAAVAELTGSRRLEPALLGIGPLRADLTVPRLGMVVMKSGRTTGLTAGRVTGIDGVTYIRYGWVTRGIRRTFTIDPIPPGAVVSDPGDSGSIWVDHNTKAAVGLHFAGSNIPERGVAMDISAVLSALRVHLEAPTPAALRTSERGRAFAYA